MAEPGRSQYAYLPSVVQRPRGERNGLGCVRSRPQVDGIAHEVLRALDQQDLLHECDRLFALEVTRESIRLRERAAAGFEELSRPGGSWPRHGRWKRNGGHPPRQNQPRRLRKRLLRRSKSGLCREAERPLSRRLTLLGGDRSAYGKALPQL